MYIREVPHRHLLLRARVIVLILSMLALGMGLVTPAPVAAQGGYMTWIDPGCYRDPVGAYASPGFHWWGQTFADGSAAAYHYHRQSDGFLLLVDRDPDGGYRSGWGGDFTLYFNVYANNRYGSHTFTLLYDGSFLGGAQSHTESIWCDELSDR